MADFFALLDEPRLPWLDPEELKKKFLQRSAELHPDRHHGASVETRERINKTYMELNQAYQVLADPKTRMAHLIELEEGRKSGEVRNVPDELMAPFMEVNTVIREADAFLRRPPPASPLLKARRFQDSQGVSGRLESLVKKLEEDREKIANRIRESNAVWAGGPAGSESDLQTLKQHYLLYSFLDRWCRQLRDRMLRLSTHFLA